MRARAGLSAILVVAASAAVLAGIVHFVVILTTPWVATRDAYAETLRHGRGRRNSGPARRRPGATGAPFADPAVAAAFCRYNLAGGPIRVRAPTGRTFSSISFHTRRGLAFYALTDKAGAQGAIEAVLATPDDVRTLASHDDEESPSRDLRIAAPEREGYVMVRVFSETPSLRAEAEDEARRLTCTPEPVPR